MALRNRVLSVYAGLYAGLGFVTLAGCSDPTTYDFEGSIATAQDQAVQLAAAAPPTAVFDPAAGDLPFPNSLLFNGSTDGTLNIPLGDTDPADLTSVQVSLNALDGFSTSAPITMQLSGAVNAETVVLGQSIRVFQVQTTPEGAVTGVTSELDQSQVAVALVGNTVAIVPVVPLAESTDYMVIATNAITTEDGAALRPSSSFILTAGATALSGAAAALEPVRQLTNTMIAAAVSEGVDAAGVVQAWTFKTQSITPVMQAVKFASGAQNITIVPTGKTTNDVNSLLPGIADIYVGALELPYYRTAPANANDVEGISSYWQDQSGNELTRFNTTPSARSIETVPVLMSVPNAGSGNGVPAEGWPIAIFVHGVTSDRSGMLALADSMAQAGIAVIAIDQPMHGITDPTNAISATALSMALAPLTLKERTFDIDLVNNETGAPGPDGVVDPSGRHFYSPQYLLATRDNLRQSVADLFVLSASIANIQSVPINTAHKTLVGHSLGGAAATPYLAFDDSISAATLGMPAAGLVETTITSQAFGPAIIAGLAAAGVVENTPEFSRFKIAAQTVVDSGDAINFGAAAAQMTPIHMIEVLGDTTVLNNVPGAPLVGTDALARVMGLATTNQDTSESAIVKFTEGNHSSLLLPTASLDATKEMQSQTALFAATKGTLIKINNADVIQ